MVGLRGSTLLVALVAMRFAWIRMDLSLQWSFWVGPNGLAALVAMCYAWITMKLSLQRSLYVGLKNPCRFNGPYPPGSLNELAALMVLQYVGLRALVAVVTTPCGSQRARCFYRRFMLGPNELFDLMVAVRGSLRRVLR